MSRSNGERPGMAERQRLARERRQKADERQRARWHAEGSAPIDHISIRNLPGVIHLSGGDPGRLFPVLIPDPLTTGGRHEFRTIAQRVQTWLGITALLAHEHFMAANVGGAGREGAADDAIAATGGLAADYLKRIGRQGLQDQQVDRRDVDLLVRILFCPPEADPALLDEGALYRAAIEAMELLATTLNRLAWIIEAVDAAHKLKNDASAADLIKQGFHRGMTTMPWDDLVRIAALADINPAAIWIQHAQFGTPIFKVAGFAGRLFKIVTHGEARLDRSLFATAQWILGEPETFDFERQEVTDGFLLVRRLIAARFDLDEVRHLLDQWIVRGFDVCLA